MFKREGAFYGFYHVPYLLIFINKINKTKEFRFGYSHSLWYESFNPVSTPFGFKAKFSDAMLIEYVYL